MGRIKLLGIGFVTFVIVLTSVVVPASTFANTRVKFVIRFPWSREVSKIKAPINPPPSPTPMPEPTLTLTPTSTPIPTVTLTPTQSPPKPTIIPAGEETLTEPSPLNKPSNQAVGNQDTYILSQVNEYRRQNGLSDVGTDQYTCDFASLRAGEISGNFSHEGFNSRISSGTLPYPDYSYVNENIAQNSDFTRVAASWIASPPHAENMRKDLSFVCIRHSGEYYVFEGWRR